MNRFVAYGAVAAAALIGVLYLGGQRQNAPENPGADTEAANGGQVEDITWLLHRERVSGVPLRDIFAPAGSIAAAKKKPALTFVKRKKAEVKQAKRQVKAWQPPRLVGIAIHRGIARAVFVDGKEVLIAAVGDRVKGYRIKRIRERQVVVQDLRNGLKRTIYLK